MGASHSISRYSNDFELVVRATKEMEYLLETHFGAPSDKKSGLHDKISHARDKDGKPLPEKVVRQMRRLVTIRNSLVHDRDFNAIPERAKFVKDFDEVEAELKALVPSNASGCAIS
jgi:hypothetical protein